MSAFGWVNEIFDYAFGWLIPDQPKIPYTGGVELNLTKPTEEPLIYGSVKRAGGVIVRSEVYNPDDGDDVPNDILFIQVVWSVGDIRAVKEVYLDNVNINSSAFSTRKFDLSKWLDGIELDVVQWGSVYHQTYANGSMTFPASDYYPELVFNGNGCSFSVLVLEYDPEKMNRLPEITADIDGRELLNTDQLVDDENHDSYALVLYDYLTNTEYGRGLDPARINIDSIIAEHDFGKTQVYRYDDSPDTSALMTCNVRLDCNETLLSNIQTLLKGCRGFLPYINNQFYFLIERPRDFLTFEITDENRRSDFVVNDTEIKDRYNKVYVKYFDENQEGKVATAEYPEDNSAYLAADKGVSNDKSITCDTINNAAEALTMAEIIFKRSRNGLKVKVSTNDEGQDTSVGQIIKVSNIAYGMVQKPFLIVNKTNHASGKQDFELLEFQDDIYPWVSRPRPEYPDFVGIDYWTVAKPTNVTVGKPVNASSLYEITWESTHDEFELEFYEKSGVNFTHLNNRKTITTAKNISLYDFQQGDYVITIRAINGLNRKSEFEIVPFTIVPPSIDSISTVVNNFSISVIPSTPDYGVEFDVYYNTSDDTDFNNAVHAGKGERVLIESLTPDTEYIIFAKAVNPAGEGISVFTETITTLNSPDQLMEFIGAAGVRLNPSSQIFADKNDETLLTPSQITLTALVTGISTDNDPLVWSSSPTVALTGSSTVKTLTGANYGDNDSVAITVATTSGSFSDTVTIVRVTDGDKGTAVKGDKGDSVVAGYLTNETHTILADAAGAVTGDLGNAGGSFEVYEGLQNESAASTFTKVSQSGLTASINSDGLYTITSLSSDEGIAVFRAEYEGVSIDLTYTITKVKQGLKGVEGNDGADANANAHLGLITRGDAVVDVTGQRLGKYEGANTWDSDVYSTIGYNSGCTLSFIVEDLACRSMLGINTDPIADSSYTSIDFALYLNSDNTLHAYENGASYNLSESYAPGDVLSIIYDNETVKYFKNGIVLRTVSVANNKTFYFDSSLHTINKTSTRALSFTASGGKGADTVEGYLTNDHHSITANSLGAITGSYDGSGGEFKVNKGGVELTSGVVYSLVSATGLTAVISSSSGVYTISNLTSTTGTAIFKAVYNGLTIIRVYTCAKSIQGDKGDSIVGSRGAGHFYAAGTSWSTSDANNATTGDNVISDMVTISGLDFSETRTWNGSSWITYAVVVDGAWVFNGEAIINQAFVNSIFAIDVTATGTITGATIQNTADTTKDRIIFDSDTLRFIPANETYAAVEIGKEYYAGAAVAIGHNSYQGRGIEINCELAVFATGIFKNRGSGDGVYAESYYGSGLYAVSLNSYAAECYANNQNAIAGIKISTNVVVPPLEVNSSVIVNNLNVQYLGGYQASSFMRYIHVHDGDGTQVSISNGKEWKFKEGGNIDINWTDTSTGSDSDPYDLTFTVPNGSTAVKGCVQLSNSYTSTSTTYGSTPYATKIAYDKGAAALLQATNSMSNTTNGYWRCKSTGMTIQWGTCDGVSSDQGSLAVSFPLTFTTACRSVQMEAVVYVNDSYDSIAVTAKSKTSFTFKSSENAISSFNWIAVGH